MVWTGGFLASRLCERRGAMMALCLKPWTTPGQGLLLTS